MKVPLPFGTGSRESYAIRRSGRCAGGSCSPRCDIRGNKSANLHHRRSTCSTKSLVQTVMESLITSTPLCMNHNDFQYFPCKPGLSHTRWVPAANHRPFRIRPSQ